MPCLAEASPSMSLTLQWVTIGIVGLAVLMPILVEVVKSSRRRRRALRELEDRERVQVYDELFAAVAAFGIAAFRGQGAVEAFLTLQARLAVVRIHSGPEITEQLDALAEATGDLHEASEARRTGEAAGDNTNANSEAMQACLGELAACLESLSDAVAVQFGPAYAASHSRWAGMRIRVLHEFVKARGRLGSRTDGEGQEE